MTWQPSQRILSSALPPSSRLRGVCPCEVMNWPDALLLSGNDYSADFSDQLAAGDRLVEVVATTSGGTVAWVSIFGTKATAWVQWTGSDVQPIVFEARTAQGASLVSTGYTFVGCYTTNNPPKIPAYAPNAFVTGNVIMPDANGNPLIFG